METIAFTNTNDIFDALESLNGSSLIVLNGYKNKQGEVSNQVVNVLFDEDLAKRNDLLVIETLTHSDLEEISKSTSQPMEIVEKAWNELITSMEKNISKDMEDKTTAAKAQINTYTHFTDGVKVHNETGEIYIFGLLHSKEVIESGESKKPVNKQKKTIAKDAIKKKCKFEMAQYRTYKLGSISDLDINGFTIQL